MTEEHESLANSHWHLDKRVPIAMLIGLFVQLLGAIWFAAQAVQRFEDQERRLSVIENGNTTNRLSVVESQMADLRYGINEVNRKLDRLIEIRKDVH